MLWKILSSISAACLAAACYFAFENQNLVKTEKELLARAESNLEQLLTRKKEAEETQERRTVELAEKEKERDQTKEDVVKYTTEAAEKEQELALLKSNLDQLTQQVAALETKIKDAGDIKTFLAQIDNLKKEQTEAEGELANKEQNFAQAQQRLTNLRDQVKAFEVTEERIRRGVVEPDFNARVAGVFPNWGFVVLNKGNNGGVFANALLDVKRGQDVIAKLRVKNVEPAIAVADVVAGSLADGQSIQSGDLVVAATDQPSVGGSGPRPPGAPPVDGGSGAAPIPGGAIPTAPPPGPGDPFGGAPAPAMGSDPFGGGAPAMDGGAPAPTPSDPFGGAPAMDGGTPAPTPTPSDPFGGAPAMDGGSPAMDGGTPAPTPTPSDPFGGAPAMDGGAPAMDGGAPAPTPTPSSDPFGN